MDGVSGSPAGVHVLVAVELGHMHSFERRFERRPAAATEIDIALATMRLRRAALAHPNTKERGLLHLTRVPRAMRSKAPRRKPPRRAPHNHMNTWGRLCPTRESRASRSMRGHNEIPSRKEYLNKHRCRTLIHEPTIVRSGKPAVLASRAACWLVRCADQPTNPTRLRPAVDFEHSRHDRPRRLLTICPTWPIVHPQTHHRPGGFLDHLLGCVHVPDHDVLEQYAYGQAVRDDVVVGDFQQYVAPWREGGLEG